MKKATEIFYTQVGDYKVPNIVLTDTTPYSIGRYGRMHQRYLETESPSLYSQMILSEKLFPHLAEIDHCCERRLEQIVKEMAKRENVTESLKASNQMEWVRRMNSIHNRAEEIILHELVYTA